MEYKQRYFHIKNCYIQNNVKQLPLESVRKSHSFLVKEALVYCILDKDPALYKALHDLIFITFVHLKFRSSLYIQMFIDTLDPKAFNFMS